MNIKIQHFTLSLFMLMSLSAVLLWSVSLYLMNDSLVKEKTGLYRNNWQIQLDQLQSDQGAWLQKRFHEVSEWMQENTDSQQRQYFVNQYYQLYPKLTLIKIIESGAVVPDMGKKIPDCLDLSGKQSESEIVSDSPLVKTCFSNSQPMLAVTADIDSSNNQKLLILMDYFSFINDFEKLTNRQFYVETGSKLSRNFIETRVHEQQFQTVFEFKQDALTVGRLTLSVPHESFFSVWLQQAIWVIPVWLFVALVFYLALFRALIHPLLLVSQRMKKMVQTRRPGNAYDRQFLTPGLLLLHKYFINLTYMTKHDHLTGLNNRAIFEERLQLAIMEGKRSGRKYALVLVDINHFYKINKKYGLYVGDGLLKQLAKRLSNDLRESDSLARLEKDNFALLLEFSDDDQITSLVEKLHQSLSKTYTVYGREINIGISIGVAIYPDNAWEKDELELKGNEALLKAHQGDWPVVFIQQPDSQTDYSGLSLIQSLRWALKNSDFKLVYQPVMDLKSHTTSYFEALLRWKRPEEHVQSIEKTIALAEKNQLIKPLSHWIIETACLQLQKLKDSPVKIAINLSMIDFHDEGLPQRIGEMLQRYGIAPGQLMIEITEGQFMQEPDLVIGILNRLSEMGISLSIDDFGTGQASLTYLKKLPVEKLKIDQSFVKNMVEDNEDSTIVEATIKLAHTLSIEVVAEGVESADIHIMLRQMGCDYVQGYYISRPLEQKLIASWIEDKS